MSNFNQYIYELELSIHRTWIQVLVELNLSELAAIAIDTEITILSDEYENFNEWIAVPKGIMIDVPFSSFQRFKDNLQIVKQTLLGVCKGNIRDSNGRIEDTEKFEVDFRVALIEVEENWKNSIRRIIINSQDPNQGIVTEKAFAKRGQKPIIYNEMKFGSKSEVRIAQELETRKVLFFPLPLAVRCDSGNFYQDHREVDFLICHDGVWGILEIAHHLNRYEKDKEKDAWFKQSGILCIEHYTAEKCFNFTKQVIDEFLAFLEKHKR